MTAPQDGAPTPQPTGPPAQPTSTPVLKDVLKYGLILALVIAVVGALLGGIFAGWIGVTSALIGTVIAAVFLSITALSILIANRFIGSDLFVGLFFGIVLGGWIVKFVLFLVLAILLRDQPWINPTVLFLSLIAGVIGSLVVDMIVVFRSRVPYVSDVSLPGEKR
ncbi:MULTISPECIES: hypothetical protein [Leifsonia]|uniref:Uncharacterized protein n=3 Tax=Leifsonia TaxID=110932 RepID=U2T6Q1_LEIAQ|nr:MULTISPECIES: hypothetical protein [Leifsonia]ERK73153.1 hypothetical protein N136_00471 [Leifsonia aquatica ATCC 14665]MBB2965816.1 hypothetical protein [Leifsonia aquatica]NYK08344.1 hypothetical protein [Leifsonia naganoensis]